jgi:hypothetical protein
MYTGVYCFIGGVIIVGLGIGFWLQAKLEETHQDVSYRGAFSVEA